MDTASNSWIMFHHFPKGKPRHNNAEEFTLDIETEYYGKTVQRDIQEKTSYKDGIRRVLYSLRSEDLDKLFREKPEYKKFYYG